MGAFKPATYITHTCLFTDGKGGKVNLSAVRHMQSHADIKRLVRAEVAPPLFACSFTPSSARLPHQPMPNKCMYFYTRSSPFTERRSCLLALPRLWKVNQRMTYPCLWTATSSRPYASRRHPQRNRASWIEGSRKRWIAQQVPWGRFCRCLLPPCVFHDSSYRIVFITVLRC